MESCAGAARAGDSLMSWLALSLLSALFLGFYDLAKKSAVNDNAVAPVLLCSCACGALIWLPMVTLSGLRPDMFASQPFFVVPISWRTHLLLLGKAVLVGTSWSFAFFALKRLPLTIAAPIRATSPLWTILIACCLMDERPTPGQWLGIATILASFLVFTLVGKLDGIHFHRDRGVIFMIVATLIASVCAIYDKILVQQLGLGPSTVQAWFSIYLVPVMAPLASYWFAKQRRQTPMRWRWAIPLIATTLLVADYLYFMALEHEDAMISLISPLRRVSVVVAFVVGGRLFGERNLWPKALCTMAMLLGVWLLSR